jgi:hypothetical protein
MVDEEENKEKPLNIGSLVMDEWIKGFDGVGSYLIKSLDKDYDGSLGAKAYDRVAEAEGKLEPERNYGALRTLAEWTGVLSGAALAIATSGIPYIISGMFALKHYAVDTPKIVEKKEEEESNNTPNMQDYQRALAQQQALQQRRSA